jgi:hypothetical protein
MEPLTVPSIGNALLRHLHLGAYFVRLISAGRNML